ncbi:MAG: MFS transporter, partial [Gammaproteobacteria bacterium]|nr:MFS transporter [Gammaproteobacteria bacterium]
MAVLNRKTLASYSGISAPMAAMGMPIAVYLPAFYAETMSLDLATVGLVFTLVRIWDFATDPIMGLAIDRFDTRWGRRKHWIAISVPILMVSV